MQKIPKKKFRNVSWEKMCILTFPCLHSSKNLVSFGTIVRPTALKITILLVYGIFFVSEEIYLNNLRSWYKDDLYSRNFFQITCMAKL